MRINLFVKESDYSNNVDISLTVDVGQIFRENYTVVRGNNPPGIGPEYDALAALQHVVIPRIMKAMERQYSTGLKAVLVENKNGRLVFKYKRWK